MPEDTKRPFHAQNWNEVDAAGLEATASYSLNRWLRELSVSYAYTWLNLDVSKSGSRYLDYLSHKAVAHIDHGICFFRPRGNGHFAPSHIGASWTLTWQKREGQFNNAEGEVCDYSPVLLLDGQLYFEAPQLRIAAECTNMTNRHYYDYGGIIQPGAWLKLSVTARL